ncbi:pyrokinin-1 receptor-like [Venturia canescens]|uniref:pyrokinin-1 receptor-like n=1 Tax=Venturia canescens TaxID=32260 RepID=UPI001C9C0F8A|nr:pyrokinin-1 receptor-like [Venturia canescens]
MIEGSAAMPEIVQVDDTIRDARGDRSTIDIFPFAVTNSLEAGGSRLQENYTAAMNALLTSESSTAVVNQQRDSLYIVVPITVIYVLIFFTGLIGNVSTCVVIARNRSMHTATNYYLFSLAISDLLLLISGLPPEMYFIWSHFPYVFGEIFCIIQSFAAETSANATVLTITAFTVERYVAICHPFLSHTMSKLSRAVKYVILIWLLALCLAIPQAIQFGVVFIRDENGTAVPGTDTCSRKWVIIQHAFEISTILFFVAPMTIITVLYVLIGIKLRRSRLLTSARRNQPVGSGTNRSEYGRGRCASQRNVIRMLVAVVVAFFICWAPFHAQRLLAVYAQSSEEESQAALSTVYTVLTYVSGVFYYLSTTVNPLLYNIMSNKFREAFKSMLSEHCGSRRSLQTKDMRRQTYSSLSRYGKSTFKRAVDRNSASLSASEEIQKLPTVTRTDVGLQRSLLRNYESSPLVNDQSRLNLVPGNSNESRKEYQRSNGRGSNNRSATPSSEPSSQISSPIVSREVKNLNLSNRNDVGVPRYLSKSHRPVLKTVTLGLIAERLRFGTRSLFANQRQRPTNQEDQAQQQRSNQGAINARTEVPPRIIPKFQSQPSIESANTISNSSLQDLGETEFTGSELANYMGELNFDLVT